MKRTLKPTVEVFQRLRNRITGDIVITSNMYPKRFGDFGQMVQVYEEQKPERKFWVTENAFDKVKS